jgi:hypothetical protein
MMGKALVRVMNPEWIQTARDHALRGIPPQDATGPDALEMEIARLAHEIYIQEGAPIIKDAEALAERVSKARSDIADTAQSISGRAPLSHLEELLKADLEAARPDNVKLLKSKKRAGTHLSVFKADHGLTGPADKQKKVIDIAARLSISLSVETFANAFFYSTGIGLLAGAGIAFIFSLVIAVLGFLAGFFGRYRNSTRLSERIWGWIAIVGGLIIAVYVSSVTATFRALVEIAKLRADAQTDLSTQSPQLFERAVTEGHQIFFLHVPFHELNATLLFALAIIAFIYAAYTGYTSSDAVPGYSKASEQFEQDEAACQVAESKLRADLARLAADMKQKRARLVTSINEAARLQRDLTIKSDSCANRLAQFAESTNSDYVHAVSSCRAENTKHRATQPPGYFAEPIPALRFETDPLVLQNLRDDLETLRREIEEVEPFGGTLNAEIIDIDRLRATLAETITRSVKAWDDEAAEQIKTEAIYDGPRAGPAVAGTR